MPYYFRDLERDPNVENYLHVVRNSHDDLSGNMLSKEAGPGVASLSELEEATGGELRVYRVY